MKASLFRLDPPTRALGYFWASPRDPGPSKLSCGPGPEGSPATAPGRAVAAPAAVFSRVSTPEAQPRKGKRTAAGFGPADQGAKKGGTPPNKLPYFDAVILVGLIIWPSSLGATHNHGLVHEVVIGPGAKAELGASLITILGPTI